jgi:hypothetical protein
MIVPIYTKVSLKIILVSSLSYATNIEINISNIKPIAGKLSIALDTKDTYNKDDKSNSVFSARKKKYQTAECETSS